MAVWMRVVLLVLLMLTHDSLALYYTELRQTTFTRCAIKMKPRPFLNLVVMVVSL